MKALIIGVTGFAGGHLAEHLLSQGDKVLGASTGGAWPADAPEDVKRHVHLVPWDIGADDGLSESAREAIGSYQPDCIYHLSAISIPSDCGDSAPTTRARAINIDGVRRAISLAESLSSPPRFLFTSSSHVYSASGDRPVSEDTPLAPRGGYGVSKVEAEKLALESNLARRAPVTVARSFQHAGPRQSSRMMLPQWAEQYALKSDGPVTVFTRDKTIDFSDVRDIVRAYRLLIERSAGGIFNVGAGQPRKTGEVLDALSRLADPSRPVVETRPGAGADPIANISRLSRLTGWTPRISLEQTVADVWSEWKSRMAVGGANHA